MKAVVTPEIADCYQPLFDLLSKEYNVILTISEMDEVIRSSLCVVGKIRPLDSYYMKSFIKHNGIWTPLINGRIHAKYR